MTTAIVWPATLPCFRFEPYNVAPRPGSTEMTLGMVTRRSMVYTENNEVVSVEMILSSAQEQALRTFFKTTTAMGTQSFLVELLMAGTLEEREATFYGAPPTFVPVAPGRVRTAFTLLAKRTPYTVSYELIATYSPNFDGMSATLDPDTSSDMFHLTDQLGSDQLRIYFPSGALYTAWSRWSGYGSDPGENPNLSAPLWENSFKVEYADTTSEEFRSTRYMTDALSLAAAQAVEPLIITGSTSYKFWLNDDVLFNRGGLSLRIDVYRLVAS